jgi:putative heme transporter
MSSPPDSRPPRVTRKRLVLGFGLTLFVGVGVALLVGKFAGFADLADELREAHPGWLAVCLAAEVVSFAGYTLVLRESVVFGDGPRLTNWAGLRLVMAGLGATRIVAAGGAGGLAVNYWVLRQAGEDPRRALLRSLGLNTLLYAVFGLAAAVSAAVLLAGVGGDAPAAFTASWLAVVGAGSVGAFLVLRPAWFERIVTVGPAAGWARRGFGLAVAGVDMVRQMMLAPGVRGRALIGACAWWAADITCLWAGLQAFDVDIGLAAIVLAYTTGYATNLLPLPTGGVGGVDAAMIFALNGLGVPLDEALLGVVAYRLFAFWLPTIPGMVALAALPRLGRELRARSKPEGRFAEDASP